MANDPQSLRWWQTVPGAIITAVTGLIVALHQAGVLDALTGRGAQAARSASAPVETATPVAMPGPVLTVPPSTPIEQSTSYPRPLPAGTEVRLGPFGYEIRAARLDRRNVEQLTLRFTVRMMNNGRYPANFWDATFRVLIEGVPRAPVGGPNKVVAGQSAEDGVVEFVVPVAAKSVVLRVPHADESTEIPVDLSPRSATMEQRK
jgi:hypothetical protein